MVRYIHKAFAMFNGNKAHEKMMSFEQLRRMFAE
jgi:hypothetical protein